MLPARNKLHTPREFRGTLRRGRRAGSRTLVVHLRRLDPAEAPERVGGPRFGLIVSKAVGNAVVRHRVSRRLRHVLRGIIADRDPLEDIVVRVLPTAAGADSATLAADLRRALAKAGRR